ncbi:MAG: DUF721 domain-containing protein [Armatimonadetes bacterium]|nr:DUF721 domain-containing protein [Armatimonadota bacterium]
MKKLEKAADAKLGALRRLGIDKEYLDRTVVDSWPDAVGRQIASATQAKSLDRGELVVAVKNSVWLQEIQFHLPEILNRLNALAGRKAVKRITLKILPIRTRKIESAPAPKEPNHIEVEIPDPPEFAGVPTDLQASLKRAWVGNARLNAIRMAMGWRACIACGVPHDEETPLCAVCRGYR